LVTSPVEQWAHGEELIERKFAVKDVASGEAIGVFQIFRRDDLVAQDELRQIRRVLRDRLYDGFTECFTLALPVAIFQRVGRVLHVDRHHMLSRRSQGRIRKRWEGNLDIWVAREVAVL